jgi:hypothetical protein
MRRIRKAVVLSCAAAALVVGLEAPAQAAGSSEAPAAVRTGGGANFWWQFGSYYTQGACEYFGQSLVQGGAFRNYWCSYEWRSGQPQGYWYLYVDQA